MKRKGKRIAIAAGVIALAILGMAVWRSWPYFRLWRLFEPLGPNAQGYPEYRQRKTGIVFVRLPGGKFLMGAQKDDPAKPNYDAAAGDHEGPVHEVKLSPFLIAKFEVSQAEWERVMDANPSRWFRGADLPVNMVSWKDSREFCAKAELELPTEAQWEYACRGGASESLAGSSKLDAIAWCRENSGLKTHPVGEKEPNGFGLHDMLGNVAEWCEDVWDDASYSKIGAAGPDPVCDWGSESRVYRGAGWSDGAGGCSAALRGQFLSGGGIGGIGLRPAWPFR